MPYTHVDPWEGHLAQVSGVSVRDLELKVRLVLFMLAERAEIHERDGLGTNLLAPHPHNDHAGSCNIYAGRPWRRHMPPRISMFWQFLVRGTLRVGEMGKGGK
jgi:hypothetical protein